VIPLCVVLGAAVGAPLRYLVSRYARGRPWGTFAVNVVGSALLGALAAAALPPVAYALVGTGFCGALSTYSTFGLETVELAREGRVLAAAGYALGSAVTCLGAAALGIVLVRF
jgi:CrcB protein